jgi:ketosteroid isomerase-like protein
MSIDEKALATLIAKDQIRELAMLYSRGVDRKDIELLRTLYAKDATDHHGKFFSGSAVDYLKFLEKSFPHMPMSGHFICNHLISVDGDRGEGEVYALCYHLIPDGKGGVTEDFKAVRYVDRYRKENGRWLFAARVVTFDLESARPGPATHAPAPPTDASYASLASRLFAHGARA